MNTTPATDSPAPQTRDAEATRARILDAALGLFAERGVADVSMRAIAERSEVTKSLIHHHFGSKEGLWDAVKEHAFARYADEQRAELERAEVADAELLRNGVVNFFRFLQQNPWVVRLFAWAHLEGDPSCGRSDAELVRLGAERIRQGQQAGVFRDDVNPVNVVTHFVNVCTHWFEARTHHAQWDGIGSDDEFLDDFLKVFLDGLAPRKTD
ncbi:MAG: TetR/AcrR family transcriptional regulator [Wenzhouxiangellaceae bacterium]|nr:TetR/AcrR family transcriptional regulator [Wenzhouxiangellaceae bacterium]